MNIQEFSAKKHRGERISMVTCYDAWSARLIADSAIDCVLVGDSLAMVVYGHDTTLPIDTDTMAAHTAAVRRGAPDKFIIGDMPFLSYQVDLAEARRNAGRLIKQGGAHAVKLEGGVQIAETIRAIVAMDIPVVGHVGLTPQSVHRMGGYRVQGREQARADQLLADAATSASSR